jgi:hypothetical protein
MYPVSTTSRVRNGNEENAGARFLLSAGLKDRIS